jgi:hypothetical protein
MNLRRITLTISEEEFVRSLIDSTGLNEADVRIAWTELLLDLGAER